MKNNKVILVLAPHTDDGELGAGGYIHQSIESGASVIYVAFSDCKDSIPDGFEKDTLFKECEKATKILGINDVRIFDFPVRRFSEKRQQILDKLIELKNELNPDEILTPSTFDIHQDHHVVTSEVIRAFKNRTILGYELPWNCLESKSNFFIELSFENLNAKINSLSKYESQKSRTYFSEGYFSNYAKFRGSLVDLEYAEAFEVIRKIEIKNRFENIYKTK